MEATLIIPDSKAWQTLGAQRRSRLRWTSSHPASSDGLGVLLYSNGNLLNGLMFKTLRDLLGARIETTDPDKICGALGIPAGEEGIVKV